MIDKKGNAIVPFEYYDFGWDYYSQGYFIVDRQLPKEPQKFALLDSTGKDITGYIYDGIYNFRKDKIVVENGLKNGVIDNKGNMFLPMVYDQFWGDNYYWAAAMKQDTLFYLDSTGKPVMHFKYSKDTYEYGLSYLFYDTAAVVPYHSSLRIINRKGQFIDHFQSNGNIRLYYENGVLGTKGKLKDYYRKGKWKTRYENGKLKEVIHYKHGLRNGKYKHWDANGHLLQDLIYKDDMVLKKIVGDMLD